MMVLNVKDKEYKVKFGYNSFCDTDLMDRTTDLLKLFKSEKVDNDKDVAGLGMIKDLFSCVRDLLFVGFQKYNPVDSKQEIGEILDDYHDEAQDGEKRGILDLFTDLSDELMNEGFLGEFLTEIADAQEKAEKKPKTPQDHKKPQNRNHTQG